MGYRLPEELRQLDIHLSSTFRDRFAWEQRHTSSIDSFMPARKQKDGECRKTSEAPSPLQFRCCTHLRLRAVQHTIENKSNSLLNVDKAALTLLCSNAVLNRVSKI